MTRVSKSFTAAALACSLALSATTGASAAGTSVLSGLKGVAPESIILDVGRRYHRHHHHGRNVGLAILGAAAATAIIAGSARAERRRSYDRCEYLDYKCSRGYRWACRQFDYRCDY